MFRPKRGDQRRRCEGKSPENGKTRTNTGASCLYIFLLFLAKRISCSCSGEWTMLESETVIIIFGRKIFLVASTGKTVERDEENSHEQLRAGKSASELFAECFDSVCFLLACANANYDFLSLNFSKFQRFHQHNKMKLFRPRYSMKLNWIVKIVFRII